MSFQYTGTHEFDGGEINVWDDNDTQTTYALGVWSADDGYIKIRLYDNDTGEYIRTIEGSEYVEEF